MGARLAYYLLVYPLSKLPFWCLYLLSFKLYVLFRVFPYRKKVIEGNLRRSFPEKSDEEIRQLVWKFYRHFTDVLAEGIKNLSISKEALQKRYVVKNPELMEELYKKGKSVLLVSGHYNNWEWLISAQNFLFPHQAMGIGMPLSSKFWDKKVNERRERFGMIVVHSKNYRTEIDKQNGQPIAILTLTDQSPGDARKSYWMNFLNQQTAVLFGAEMMAHEYDFAVVFYHTRKLKRGFYEMELKLIAEEPKSTKWGEITEAHTHLLEDAILEAPEQWLWSHKRWKREVPNDLEQLKQEQQQKFEQRFGV
ncbi:MAG: lysophospholipid acyltransferase family protein [Crocinitomicaceae bacterium]|nr:lysophospholipid acyltransferase family protein [Crocinitomicaceae bacterium]